MRDGVQGVKLALRLAFGYSCLAGGQFGTCIGAPVVWVAADLEALPTLSVDEHPDGDRASSCRADDEVSGRAPGGRLERTTAH
jgi:hypothetical protein